MTRGSIWHLNCPVRDCGEGIVAVERHPESGSVQDLARCGRGHVSAVVWKAWPSIGLAPLPADRLRASAPVKVTPAGQSVLSKPVYRPYWPPLVLAGAVFIALTIAILGLLLGLPLP